MSDGVTIRRVIMVPSQDKVPMKKFDAFYKDADKNQDGILTRNEIKDHEQLAGLFLIAALAGGKTQEKLDANLKTYHEKYDQFAEPSNIINAYWGELDPVNTAEIKNKKTPIGVSLESIKKLAERDGDKENLSLKDLGNQKVYDYETKELTDVIPYVEPKNDAKK